MTPATFAPARVHSGSLPWLYLCLHDTTTKCHAGASHTGVRSPRLLYRSENFTPVRNFASVSCKRERTTRFGVKSDCRWTGTGSACVMFAILNHTCILSAWSAPSNNRDMKWPSSCKRDTKSKSHPGVKLALARVFSCKHLLSFIIIFVWLTEAPATRIRIFLKTLFFSRKSAFFHTKPVNSFTQTAAF